jgi:LPXTG-site transpeptidase (sortase) family protein
VGAVESLPVSGLESNPLSVEVNSEALVNEIERGLPPGLEQNPLPVLPMDEAAGAEAGYAASVRSPGPNPAMSSSVAGTEGVGTGQGAQEALDQLMREAGQVAPGVPPQTTFPVSVPAATSPPTRIVAPAIDLDSDVVSVGWKLAVQGGKPVSVWEVAEYAAGWHQNSALPGNGGNVVLSGHHNTKGEVFRYIVDLKPGDTVTLYADDQPYTYTVESRFVVRDKGVSEEKRRENARWIGRFPDERLTLVTCWPYRNNTHRVIVVAKPAEQVN